MFNPFNYLKQQVTPHYLGVDIGTTSIKVVEVEQGKTLPRLLNYGVLESQNALGRVNVAFQTSSLKLFEQETLDILKGVLKKMKPNTMDAVATLPIFSVFTTVLVFPEMSDGELQKSMAYQARQYIPQSINEVSLDWYKVGSYEDIKGNRFNQVLLVAVPQDQISKYKFIFKEAGLNLKSLEVDALSLVRGLTGNDPTPTLILDIGSRSTLIAIAEAGTLKFTSQTDFAGSSLTQAIASSLNINPLRAEELKKEKGIAGTGASYELSTIMLPFLDVIINEVKRAKYAYESQFTNAAKLERIILSGGGANLLGIEKYVGSQLEIPAVKANPLLRFEYPPVLEPLAGELNPILSVSLGTVLRQFI